MNPPAPVPLLDSPLVRAVRFLPAWVGHRRGYRLADRIARLADPRLRGVKRVRHPWGEMAYDLDSYVERLMAYELFGEELGALIGLLLRPGDTAVEAGMHIGSMAVRMLERVGPTGRLIGFEASPPMLARLEKNLALNPAMAPRCTIHRAALHEEAGRTVTFYCDERGIDSTLASTPQARAVEVPTTTFDATLAEAGPVRFMKMDIEGAEVLALRGGQRWLGSRDRPDFILSEINDPMLRRLGSSAEELFALFLAHGYRPLEVEWAGRGQRLRARAVPHTHRFPENADLLLCRDEERERELMAALGA